VSHERRETIEDENGQCVRAPGEDSTGAGAERELGFDPQSKAELAQGEYKGAREVLALARHVHTAHRPAVGWPGGVLRTQRTTQTQPSWMCSFDDIRWHFRTWGGSNEHPRELRRDPLPAAGGLGLVMLALAHSA
jgi:hypothetical protein